jgi:hypothetical protein
VPYLPGHSAVKIVISRLSTGVLALTISHLLLADSRRIVKVGNGDGEERGRGGGKEKREGILRESRGGRLTTCHTLRAWHAGLIIL